MACEHIPEKLVNTFGDYSTYENAVYQEYLDSFSNKEFYYDGKKISEKKHPEISGKSCTFWHIVSSGNNEENKLPDFDRYERVGWPGFILRYCLSECANRLIWENKRHSKERVLIYCPDIDYLVILDKRDGYYIFWTAYPVKYQHVREKLMKEYKEYLDSKDLS